MIRPSSATRKNGAALLIVLAFVVLLTALIVTYFSRTAADRQLAKASSNDTVAELLARSAVDIVVADYKKEIANGPAITNSNVVPQRSPKPAAGSTPAIPNLIRRSVRSDAIPGPAVDSHASAVNSMDASLNNRSISLARWNAHYLVPKSNTGDNSSDPITTGFIAPNYWAPDWIIITRAGPAVFNSWNNNLSDTGPANSSYAVGRYAFAVYDEGGLLDFNVAGYPYPSPSPAGTPASLITNIGRKGAIGFADLTGMRLTGSNSSTPNPTTLTKMIAWRNYATIQPSGSYPSLTSVDPTATSFVTYALSTTRDFRTVATSTFNNQTDQALVSRRELIELFRSVGGSFNMLQNLGTFSRETNRPTWGTLVTARFPLSRFDLFGTTPPAPSDAARIQTAFGLVYVPAVTTPTPVAEHWTYVGTSGSSRQSTISSISSATQDTDLPSLLQYALPSGTSTAEILSIEASLIDQRDSNDDTTWIEFGPAGPPQIAWGVDRNPAPTPAPRPAGTVVVLNRSFRNVGELGYAYRNASTSLDFHTSGSIDAPLLDLFTYNTASTRAGVVNLNTQNPAVLTAIVQSAISDETSGAFVSQTDAGSNHAKTAYNAVTPMIGNATSGTSVKPILGRQEVTRLVANGGAAIGTGEEAMETVARAFGEIGQSRTWGLFIDVIAQSGRYPANAASLTDFVVQGEKRYWLHIAIDRFTGQVIEQQLEAVNE
jgi:hypothetical protein